MVCVADGAVPVIVMGYVPAGVADDVAIVRVLVAPVVTDAGLNVAPAPEGRPDAVSTTDSAEPDTSDVATVAVAAEPAAAEPEAGLAAMEKSLIPVPVPATWPIFSTLYWLPSNASNSPFSPATSFNKTSGNPIGLNGVNGIDYSGTGGIPPAMSAVWSSPVAGNLVQGFDYELRLSGTIPASQFNVYIVYTVIGN